MIELKVLLNYIHHTHTHAHTHINATIMQGAWGSLQWEGVWVRQTRRDWSSWSALPRRSTRTYQHSREMPRFALYCIALYCIVLYCILLHHNYSALNYNNYAAFLYDRYMYQSLPAYTVPIAAVIILFQECSMKIICCSEKQRSLRGGRSVYS